MKLFVAFSLIEDALALPSSQAPSGQQTQVLCGLVTVSEKSIRNLIRLGVLQTPSLGANWLQGVTAIDPDFDVGPQIVKEIGALRSQRQCSVNRKLLAFARTTITCILTCAAVLGIQPGEAASKCGDRNALSQDVSERVRRRGATGRTDLGYRQHRTSRKSENVGQSVPGSDFGHGLVEPIGDGKPECLAVDVVWQGAAARGRRAILRETGKD